jgi:hypothetical protein
MPNRIKPSRWLLLSLAVGVVVAIALGIVLPGWAWWAYALCGFITAAGVYSQLVQLSAAERTLDRD